MPKRFRLSLCFLLLAAWPALLSAQEAAQEGDPAARFLIERITVEGIQRGSARAIVAAETRLRAGETYSEPALRQAIYRVKRLPFVLDAGMSLRRGSERGAYELVITVEPTRPVFFLAETGGTILPADLRDRLGDSFVYSSGASAGVRHFLGARGLVFASVDKRESSAPAYQAGYTRYNLVGLGSYGSVGFRWSQDDEGFSVENATANAELGLPLAANHSLRSSFFWARSVGESELTLSEGFGTFEITSRSEAWGAGLDWIYDTTDDPVFPTQGEKLIGSVNGSQGESRGEIRPFIPDFLNDSSDTSLGLSLFGRRHFRLTARQSAAAGAYLSLDERELEREREAIHDRSRFFGAGVEGRHSLSLWGFEKTERIGDLRLESAVFVNYSRASISYLDDVPSETAATLATSLVFRNAWGILRASLSYSEDDL